MLGKSKPQGGVVRPVMEFSAPELRDCGRKRVAGAKTRDDKPRAQRALLYGRYLGKVPWKCGRPCCQRPLHRVPATMKDIFRHGYWVTILVLLSTQTIRARSVFFEGVYIATTSAEGRALPTTLLLKCPLNHYLAFFQPFISLYEIEAEHISVLVISSQCSLSSETTRHI